MIFDDDFFKEEVRYGFLITEKMKRIRAADLEVLRVIDDVCQRNGIEYFADFGTLLGAVRHQGFIPWDDDMDLCMKRADFEAFFSLSDSEFPDGIVRRSRHQDPNNNNPMGAVLNTSDISFDSSHLERYHGCPYVIGADVFPLDNVADDDGLFEAHTFMYGQFYDATLRFDQIEANEGIDTYIPTLEALGGFGFDRSGSIKEQLVEMTAHIAALINDDECENIAYLTDIISGGEKRVLRKKSWYDKAVRLPFENMDIPVPVGFKDVLKMRFGEGFMTARPESAAHDYPFYKKQDDFIDESFPGGLEITLRNPKGVD